MRRFAFAALTALFCTASAQAHFIWTRVLPGGDPIKSKIEVSFGEEAGAGEAHLVEKIKQTKTWPITADKSEPLSMTEFKNGEIAGYQADVAIAGLLGVEAVCDYGVLAKGGAPFQLNYFAKTLTTAGLADPQNALAKNSKLQVAAKAIDHALELTVLWDGKPLAGNKLVVAIPGGTGEVELTTDDKGNVRVETSAAGQLWARALYTENMPGEKDGKKYDSIKNYATLTVPVVGKPEAVATGDVDAPALLSKARDNRAVWDDFIGLKGNAILSDNGVKHEAAFAVDEEGEVTLKMPDGPARKWLLSYLKSMVQHRLPTANIKENVKYVQDNDAHPLGVKLSLGDGEMDSHYRVRDNAVLEVNRKMGKGRFTISVLETIKNPLGKYLATVFTVNTWNGDGELISSMTESDEYTRIEKLDVPKKITQTNAGKNQLEVRVLELKDLEIPKAKATASK